MSESSSESPLRQTHKDLYETLVAANERIKGAGAASFWVLALAALGACITIHQRWITEVFGRAIDDFRGWGVYLFICVAAFVVFMINVTIREKQAYNASKQDIVRQLDLAGMTPESLLADIADDEALEKIRELLIGDPGVGRPGEFG